MNNYFPEREIADRSVSAEISEFLEFLRSAKLTYQMAQADQEQYENNTQDILHELELKEHTEANKTRLADALKHVRQARRNAKDTVEELQPIVKCMDAHSEIYNHLERLLGDVRKVENKHQNRFYVPRTDIVELSVEDDKQCLESDFEGDMEVIEDVYEEESIEEE